MFFIIALDMSSKWKQSKYFSRERRSSGERSLACTLPSASDLKIPSIKGSAGPGESASLASFAESSGKSSLLGNRLEPVCGPLSKFDDTTSFSGKSSLISKPQRVSLVRVQAMSRSCPRRWLETSSIVAVCKKDGNQ